MIVKYRLKKNWWAANCLPIHDNRSPNKNCSKRFQWLKSVSYILNSIILYPKKIIMRVYTYWYTILNIAYKELSFIHAVLPNEYKSNWCWLQMYTVMLVYCLIILSKFEYILKYLKFNSKLTNLTKLTFYF